MGIGRDCKLDANSQSCPNKMIDRFGASFRFGCPKDEVEFRKGWSLRPIKPTGYHHSAAFKLSKTPGVLSRPAPLLGQDNEYVMKDLVGLSDEEYIELLADGAFE